jgi:hypothetical protein
MKFEGKALFVGVLALAAYGCSDGGSKSHTVLPWETGTRVIDDERGVTEVTTPAGDQCLDVETGTQSLCIKPQEECAGNAADVVLDAAGKLLEIVCYPPAATLGVEELDARQGMVAQNENNAAIVLDDVADGADIVGDVAVDANNVVIWGEDPATARIEGDVSVAGNNIIVRGVHITGDVSILANDSTFLHCVVDGDVVIEGNNSVFVGCDVFGSITVKGNNTNVSGNRVVGGISDGGKNTRCEANHAATDADADGLIEESELGEPLSC